MKLNIPFYPMSVRYTNYCGQYVLKPILKFLLKKDYSIKHLAKTSEKFDAGFTLTIGLAHAALKEKLHVTYLTKSKDFVGNDVPEIEDFYGGKKLSQIQKKAQVLFKKSKKLGLVHVVKKPSFKDIFIALETKSPIVVIIDYGKIYKIKRQIFHFVIITGYDNKHIFFHDVGPNKPTKNKKLSRKLFLKAWSAKGTDMDTLIFKK